MQITEAGYLPELDLKEISPAAVSPVTVSPVTVSGVTVSGVTVSGVTASREHPQPIPGPTSTHSNGPRNNKDRNNSYAMGYSNIFMELLERRSAHRNAAHLLPHLLPGMTLLDLGCGPGSITTGLAKAVHPGRTHGVDLNEEQLGLARRRAQELGLKNLEFHQSNALRLPFPDHHFDAVHCHGFLMHSPCIKEQLTEILRVLKPRGILASRDMDVPTSFITPALLSHKIFGILAETIRREGGDPWMGRRLKVFFLNAGLEEVETGFGADYFTQPEDVEFLRKFLLEWGLSEEFMLKTGGSDLEFNQSREQVKRWSRHPGAVGCFHFGHAVGRKPG